MVITVFCTCIPYHSELVTSAQTECEDKIVLKSSESSAAESNESNVQNSADKDLEWKCGSQAALTIKDNICIVSGTGDMDGYEDADAPWSEYKEQVEHLVVSSGITSVGDHCFYGFSKLKNMNFPETLEKIGAAAFCECYSLNELFIPENIKEIGSGSFFSSGVQNIYYDGTKEMWQNIKKGDYYVYDENDVNYYYNSVSGEAGDYLKWIYCADNESFFLTGFGDTYNYSKNSSPWKTYAENISYVRLDEKITSFGDYVFEGFNKLSEISNFNCINNIGEGTFQGCTNLKEVYLPDNINEIGANAFGYDLSGEKISDFHIYGLSDSAAEKYAAANNIDFIVVKGKCGEKAFFDYEQESGVLTIYGTGDMYNYNYEEKSPWSDYAEEIQTVNINGNIQRIGANAFYGLKNLTQLNLNEGAEVIGERAFSGCEKLENVVLPDSVTTLEGDAFGYCAELKEIVIPAGMKTISGGAFITVYDSKLCRVYYKGTQEEWNQIQIGEYNEDLKSAIILHNSKSGKCGDNLYWAYSDEEPTLRFYGYGKMEDYTGQTQPWNEFAENIKSAVFSDMMTSVGRNAFNNCTSLSFVKISDPIESIGERAFFNCLNLNDVYVDKNVKVIENQAFGYFDGEVKNSEFIAICFLGTAAETYFAENKFEVVSSGNICGENSVYTFDNQSGTLTIYGAGDTYDYCLDLNDDNSEVNKIIISNHITGIGDSFFSNFENAETVTLPDNLKSIGSFAFANFSSIESLRFSDSLDYIGIGAFEGCTKLKKLIFNGDAPAADDKIFNADKKYIYYHFSKKGWDDFRSNEFLSDYITYIDLDKASQSDHIVFVKKTDKLSTGDVFQLEIELDPNISTEFEWETSDPSVVQVSPSGLISAYKEGTAKITVKSKDRDCTASCEITVSDDNNKISSLEKSMIKLDGAITNNISRNNYDGISSNKLNSYLTENADGTFTRIENIDSEEKYIDGEEEKQRLKSDGIIVETYSEEFKLMDSFELESQLSKCQGFFSGAKYNFLVFAQDNNNNDDSAEVLRIVRYNKEWKEEKACSIRNIDVSNIPNYSLRMTENDKYLYINACRGLYNMHQKNLTIAVDKETMEMTAYDFGGWVSHSFNQFIQIDDDYVYCADHGDGYPRAVVINRFNADVFEENNLVETYAFPIIVEGDDGIDNLTGVSVGGFSLSDSTCIIAGNTVDQSNSKNSTYGQRNIFVTVTDKSLSETDIFYLTDYEEGSNIKPRTPQLVKINSNIFLVMWEEENTVTSGICTKAVLIDCNVNLISDINNIAVRLSDCQPIVTSEGSFPAPILLQLLISQFYPQSHQGCVHSVLQSTVP